MSTGNRETFFRPEECARQESSLPVDIYRLCRSLLRDSGAECVFVPIRSMQFQAVIDAEEIIFIDAQDYMVHEGVGGRVILLAWRLAPVSSLESLAEPVPCTVLYYRPGLADVQRRLVGEFARALEQQVQRNAKPDTVPRILSFNKG